MSEKEPEQLAPEREAGKEDRPGSVRTHPPDLLTINDQERGITPEDSDDVKWNFINGACRHRVILSGIVSGIEKQDTDLPVAVIDYEGVRILIPACEMFVDKWPEDEPIPREYRIRLGRILGATVDFLLVGVDIRERAAVASRRAAMKQRQARYYASGRVKIGTRLAARVIGVSGGTITVEALGVDSVIKASDLAWEWFADVADIYSTGDLVVARVMGMKRNEDTGDYSVTLSVKAATENPDLPALRKLVVGSNYFGTVTGVHDRLIFVRLQAGANAKTKLYHTREIPAKLDTVSFQVRSVNEEYGVAFGLITRIIRRHNRMR